MRSIYIKKMKQTSTDSYSHVLKYTGIFGGVQGLNIVVSLVRNKLIAILLGPNGMGLVSLFNSTVNFISQSTNFGISFSAVKHVSELYDRSDEAGIQRFIQVVRTWSLLTALLGMLVCIVAGPYLSSSTFAWGNHTLHFVLLAPAVALLAITGGETAILKGTRQLRSLAVIQIYNALLSLIIAIPTYYFFGQAGIVPVIVLMALAAMLLTVRHSLQLYPLHLSGQKGKLREGSDMVKLGVAFVLAAVMGSGAEMFIRSYLNVVSGDLDVVGLYNAGFMLTVTYAGMVFSAMEPDYFPRLSAVGNDVKATNLTINRQIEVSLLIVSPLLSGLIVFVPLLIPLLLSDEFLPIVAMVQVSVFSMYLKALSLPIGYTNLAKGNSVGYLLIETAYYVSFILLTIYGYQYWGLVGTGVALVVSYVIELVAVATFMHYRYGYVVSAPVVRYFLIQFLLGVLVYLACFISQPLLHWGIGVLGILLSSAYSLHVLRRKSSLWKTLTRRFSR